MLAKLGIVADVYATFLTGNIAEILFCNAALLPNINLDFHPNVNATKLIARIISNKK